MVTTLGEILPEAARRFGDSTALVIEDARLSFSELDARSSQVANGLLSLGVQTGDRVTLYGPNCWEWVVAYYAVAKAGGVVNPISSMLTADEVAYVVADSGARVLMTSAEKGGPILDLVGRGDLAHVVMWGSDEVPDDATPFSTWLEEQSASLDPIRRTAGDLAAICYTSGTTGHPKGAMQSNRAVVSAGVGTALMGARGPGRSGAQLTTSRARVRIVRAERRDAGRLDAGHRAPVRGGGSPGCGGRAPGHVDGRCAHGVLLPVGTSRLRPCRPVEPDSLLGWRADAARRQGDRVHAADGLPDPRGVGHDRAGGGCECQSSRRAEQAGHDRPGVSGKRHAGRRHRRSERGACPRRTG